RHGLVEHYFLLAKRSSILFLSRAGSALPDGSSTGGFAGSIMSAAAEPRSASTVILLRSGDNGGVEVFLTRRPEAMDFLGGAYVVPGGTVRKDDCAEKIQQRCRGLSATEARDILGAHLKPEVALGHWVAGIREVFEEVGVLLCASEGSLAAKKIRAGAR